MAQSAAEMNTLLDRMTLVRAMSFLSDAKTRECELFLRLTTHGSSTQFVELRAEGVTELELREFGGGVTQLCCLRVKDVRALQHDRIAFELEDLEDNRFFLRCRSVTVVETVAGPNRA